MKTRIALVVLFTLAAARMASADTGVLLLAHGGQAEWNARVKALAAKVNATKPTEVAFGMATRANLQQAVDRLVVRGVTEIVAVPLFVSSWSSPTWADSSIKNGTSLPALFRLQSRLTPCAPSRSARGARRSSSGSTTDRRLSGPNVLRRAGWT